MAALSLAIIGKNNEPLYMRDFQELNELSLKEDFISEEELLGLSVSGTESKKIGGFDCSLRHQFILHAAVDRFEQLAGPPPGIQWRKGGVSGSDAMFAGLLCPVEEMRVYGYMTSTKIMFLLVVEGDTLPEHQPNVDQEIKLLLVQLHRLFIEYTLNPFNAIGDAISSPKFDEGVSRYISTFNQSEAMI